MHKTTLYGWNYNIYRCNIYDNNITKEGGELELI